MAYEVHITRKVAWDDGEGRVIERSEWDALVTADPAIELAGGGPSAVWNGHPRHGETGHIAFNGVDLLYSPWSGWISVEEPDAPALRKMLEMAGALDASVRGDDGEVFRLQDGSPTSSPGPRRFCRGGASEPGADEPVVSPRARRGGLARRLLARIADKVIDSVIPDKSGPG